MDEIVSDTKAFRSYTMNGVTCQATGRRSSSRDDKKYERTVRYNDSERVVHYGDPNMEMQRDNPERRRAFLDRHSCGDKKDPFAPGFWACYDWKNTGEGKDMDADEITVVEDEQTTISGDTKAGRMLSQSNASAIMDAVRQLMVVLERAGVSMAADEEPMTEETLKAMLTAPDRPVAYGSAIKALGNGRFGGYGVVYGSDQQRDTDGEYFTKDTDYSLDWFDKRPLIYAHGLDDAVKTMPFGVVDTIKQDDVGLYAEGAFIDPDTVKEWGKKQRQIHKWYLGEIKRMMDEGILYYSSGSVKHLVAAVDGRIDAWPIIEMSMTPAPAFPPIYSKTTTILAFKSLPVSLGATDPEADTDPEEPTAKEANVDAEVPVVESDAPDAIDNEPTIETEQPESTGETETMDINQVLNAVESALGITLTEEQRAQVMQALETDAPSEEAMAAMNAEQAKAAADAFAQKAIAAVGRVANGQKATNGVVDAIKNLVQAAQPQSQVSGNGHTGAARVEMTDRRYDHLSAEDMVFGARVIADASVKGIVAAPNETFLRVTAEKLDRAMDKGKYADSYEARSIKGYVHDLASGAAIKSDEILATNLANNGTNWVGVAYSDQLWEAARNRVVYQQLLAKGMMQLEVPQGHNSIYIPTEGSDPTWYTMVELNDETSDERAPVVVKGSTPTLNRRQLTPAGLGARVRWTDFMDEDSLISLLPFYRSRMELTAAETLENVMINGDTDTSSSTNINLIDGTPSTDAKGRGAAYLAFNGILKLALVTTSTLSVSAGGAISDEDYVKTLALLPSSEQEENDRLLYVVDPATYLASLRLAQVKTQSELGSAATIISGVLRQMYGIDLARSGQMAKANSAGKIPAAGGTLGRIVIVRPDQWALGFKRNVTTEVARDIEGGATVVVSTMRVAIQSRTTTGGVAVTYNVGVA